MRKANRKLWTTWKIWYSQAVIKNVLRLAWAQKKHKK